MDSSLIEDEPSGDGAGGGEATLDDLLEALLVHDAALTWDPATGQARISATPKIGLDSPHGAA